MMGKQTNNHERPLESSTQNRLISTHHTSSSAAGIWAGLVKVQIIKFLFSDIRPESEHFSSFLSGQLL